MQEHKEEHKHKEEDKNDSTHPIIVWIIASILFHALLALISIVLHLDDYHDANISKKDDRFLVSQQEKKSATMMLDQIKQTTVKTSVEKSKSIEKKPEEKPIEKQIKPEDPNLIHTLIPGRKGLDEQNITDQLSNAQGEKPKDIRTAKDSSALDHQDKPKNNEKIEKKLTPPQEHKKAAAPKLKAESAQKPVIEKKELLKNLSKIASNRYTEPNMNMTKQQDDSIEQEQEEILKKLTTVESNITEPKTSPSPQSSSLDQYQYVPKQTMSLKDLQLGFNQYLSNVGNTECLIQQGNTSAVPDGQSLKNITYKNQFAKTMIGSIHTHPKAKLMQYKRNKQLSFVITIDRKGKLLDLKVTKESGDPAIDTIIIESLQSAGLYPAVPSFISDDPYVQQWTILY